MSQSFQPFRRTGILAKAVGIGHTDGPMKTTCTHGLFLLLFFLASAGYGADTTDRLWQFLDEEHLLVDPDRADRASGEALLKTIDPGARLMTPEEAEHFKAELAHLSSIHPDHDTPLLEARELPEEIGYLKPGGLFEQSAPAIEAKLEEWSLKGLASLILDVRGAGGLHFDSVRKILAHYVSSETMLYRLVNARGEEQARVHTEPAPRPYRFPTVILTDSNTVDACRALVAVMKTHTSAVVVGQAASSDNRVRSMIVLEDDTPRDLVLYIGNQFLRATSAETPLENETATDVYVPIDQPRREVEIKERPAGLFLSEEVARDKDLANKVDHDPVLRRGVDILLGIKALGMGSPREH